MLVVSEIPLAHRPVEDYKSALAHAFGLPRNVVDGQMQDEATRLQLFTAFDGPSEYYRTRTRVREELVDGRPRPSDLPIFRSARPNEDGTFRGRYGIAGLEPSTVVGSVVPFLLYACGEVRDADTVGIDEKLRRVAGMHGVTHSEAQVDIDGNRRLGRIFHGLVEGGPEWAKQRAENPQRALNNTPDGLTEKIILRQNATRLARGLDSGSYLTDRRVDRVAPDVTAACERAYDHIESALDGLPIDAVAPALGERMDWRASKGLLCKTVGCLLVEGYGPAALALALGGDRKGLGQLDLEEMEAVCRVSEQLHASRIESLIGGIARGGTFPYIDRTPDGTYAVATHQWMPQEHDRVAGSAHVSTAALQTK